MRAHTIPQFTQYILFRFILLVSCMPSAECLVRHEQLPLWMNVHGVCAASKIKSRKNMREIIVNCFRFDLFSVFCSFALLDCIILPRWFCYRFSFFAIGIVCMLAQSATHSCSPFVFVVTCREASFIFFLVRKPTDRMHTKDKSFQRSHQSVHACPMSQLAAKREKVRTNINMKAKNDRIE